MPGLQSVGQFSSKAEDGAPVNLHYYSQPYGGAPVIVVAHDWGGSFERWQDIAERFQKLGFGVILFNFRGHGDAEHPYYYFTDKQVENLGLDLKLAVRFAKDRSGGKVLLVGAGLGANLALQLAAQDESIKKVAAISPGLDYRGIQLDESMAKKLGKRVFFIASQEDSFSVHSIEIFSHYFESPPETKLYATGGHGVWILKRLPESLVTLARWLSE